MGKKRGLLIVKLAPLMGNTQIMIFLGEARFQEHTLDWVDKSSASQALGLPFLGSKKTYLDILRKGVVSGAQVELGKI